MKNFDLKKYLAEGHLLKENTGLITFEQLKQACANSYEEYISSFEDEDEDNDGMSEEIVAINQSKDMGELIDTLDALGFNGDEAYDFIFDSILK